MIEGGREGGEGGEGGEKGREGGERGKEGKEGGREGGSYLSEGIVCSPFQVQTPSYGYLNQ